MRVRFLEPSAMSFGIAGRTSLRFADPNACHSPMPVSRVRAETGLDQSQWVENPHAPATSFLLANQKFNLIATGEVLEREVAM